MRFITKRDKKNRVLRTGERQREDGSYEYRYQDPKGKTISYRSWKLVDTDKQPKGTKEKLSIRAYAAAHKKDVSDNIDCFKAGKTTLNEFFEDYIQLKNIKQGTMSNYFYMYNHFVKDKLGYKKIAQIKYSDCKKLYVCLLRDAKLQPNTIDNVHTILHPIFDAAVRDDIIRKNPTDGLMAEIKQSFNWEKPKKHALSVAQQRAFMKYVAERKENNRWYTLFAVLLGTGCRAGEVCGLTWADCDFENRELHIDRTLQYRKDYITGETHFWISTPKTRAGKRIIPMFDEVYEALVKEREKQEVFGKNETIIDGYSGFIFQSRLGGCQSPHNINRAIERIRMSYNIEETQKAVVEDREPVLLPHFSVHQLRHTFCTRLCENENNYKIIQEIMGHSDIQTTMDIYNEATKEKKHESFKDLQGKVFIC